MLIDDRHDLVDRLATSAANVPAGEVLCDRVDVVDATLGVGRDNAITDRLQRYLGTLFFPEDPGLRLLALGDVRDRALVGDDRSVLIANRARVLEHDNLFAVLAPQAIFKILDDALCFQLREHALAVDRIDIQHGRTAGRLEVIRAVVTEHINQCRVDGNDVSVPGGDVHTFDDILKQTPVAGLAVLESFFVELLLDRDAGKPGHAPELVEFVGRGQARLVEVNIQRTDDTRCRAAQRE